MCFVCMQECTSKAGWGWVIGPCKSNRLWRLLVSIIFKCLSLQIFWESGYRHSSALITPPGAPGKTALSTSLQTEHPLHGTHWVTWCLAKLPPSPASVFSQAGLLAAPGCSARTATPPWATSLPLLLIAAYDVRRSLSPHRVVFVGRAGYLIHVNSANKATWWVQPCRRAGGRVCLSWQCCGSAGTREPAAQRGLSRGCPQPHAGDEIPLVDLKGVSQQVWLLQMRHAPCREDICFCDYRLELSEARP